MTAIISYTVENTNNEYKIGSPSVLPTILEGIYGNRDWAYSLSFSGIDSKQGDPIVITSISTSVSNIDQSYITKTNSANVVSMLKNPPESIFADESYRFVVFGSEIESTFINLSNIPTGLNVIAWDTPLITEITASYTFNITYNVPKQLLVNQTTAITLNQDFFWDFEFGAVKLQQQVANSEY